MMRVHTKSKGSCGVKYVDLISNSSLQFIRHVSGHCVTIRIGSFSHDVTATILVYKTINGRPYWCTKKGLWGVNSLSSLKTLFCSNKFSENDLLHCVVSHCTVKAFASFTKIFRKFTEDNRKRITMCIKGV